MRRHVERFITGIPATGIIVAIVTFVIVGGHAMGWRVVLWIVYAVLAVLLVYCIGGLAETFWWRK